MKQLIVILSLLIAGMSMAQNDPLFERGKEHYKDGSYTEAIASWMKIIDKGEHSANLYFNLGNAHYKLNNIGPSIYYYEKALQMDPLDRDIKTNLAFAENARIDDINPLPKTIFVKWHETVSGILTYNGWAMVAVIGCMLFVLLFLGYYFSSSEQRKRLLFAGSLVCIVVLLASLGMAFQTYSESLNDKPAIIFAESIQVKNEPSLGGETAFVLHEGTKVQLIGEDADWVRVRLVDGKDGWMPKSDLKPL
jgi:tetratricopeptide (TPR) repeat protein